MRETTACGGASLRKRHGAEDAINPHPHHKSGPEGSIWIVAGAQFHGALKQIVDGPPPHGAPLAKIAQAIDVVVAGATLRFIDVQRSVACSSSRNSRTVAMSSKDATAIATARPQTISTALIAALSEGSDTARPKTVITACETEKTDEFPQESLREKVRQLPQRSSGPAG